MPPLRAQLSLLAVLLLSQGCSESNSTAQGSPPADAGPVPWVRLGTGESEFEPWEGEPTLELSAGVQGGFHVWVSFVVSGLAPYGPNDNLLGLKLSTRVEGVEDSRLSFEADLATRQIPRDGEQVPTAGSSASQPSQRTFAGYPAQVDNARCAHDKRIFVELTLTGSDQRSVTTEATARLAVEESNRGQSCP